MPSFTTIILPFLLGFLTFFKIELIGAASANEVLLVVALPFYADRVLLYIQNKAVRKLLIWGGLYLFALIFSDLYRHTPAEDYLRGWTRVGITLFAFVTLGAILSAERKGGWLPFLIGWFLAPMANILVYGIQTELYKFYLGGSVSFLSFAILGYLPTLLAPIGYALPLMAAATAFLNDSRSAAGITLLAFLIVALRASRKKLENWSARKLIMAALGMALGAVGIIQLYGYAASRGYFGEDAYDKYMSQVRPGDERLSSILLGGRMEIYFTWPKIAESPLIGYGSWPKDWIYIQGRAAELEIPSLGALLGSRSNVEAGLIPSHSHIMGAWLEAGIFGGIFWAYALWLALRLLASGHITKVGRLWPVLTYVLVSFVWDLFFSPYGGERRIWNGFVLAWILTITMQHEGKTAVFRAAPATRFGPRPRRSFRPFAR